jgi:hypothetical protein
MSLMLPAGTGLGSAAYLFENPIGYSPLLEVRTRVKAHALLAW